MRGSPRPRSDDAERRQFYLGQRSWFLLVGERGWDFERAERWLAAAAKEALLKEP
ncbi:hypothetical protein OHB01_03160 [Microbispora hainanensis]|uniref:Uncharacterized protein n=1 Tax=Microbispora hainanensis TaxID=568844 RepID=A0ABZ1SQN3_9ACTN|nr:MULTISPECIES: hypothetical protein [Microbispora]NJP24040.1 hypothetical protein [Microbispora sp. CL1-1]